MNPFFLILNILSTFVTVYAVLCVIRIILTWIPGANGSGFSNFLAKICDPYLNLFHKIKWMRAGNFDFSPAVALCILSAVAALLGSFSGHGFSLSYLLQTLVGLVWNIVNSVLSFIIIVLAVRLIIMLVKKTPYTSNPILNAIDSSLGVFAGRVAKTFSKNATYKAQLITTIIVLVVVAILGSVLTGAICNLLSLIPV